MVSTFVVDNRYIHLNLRSYEQDGVMIQNITEWGETWEEFPQLLWNRSAFVVYWHNQYEWYTIFRTAFDLRGNMIELPKSVRESIRNRSNELCHPARIRAVLNIVPEEEVQEVAFFAWEGQPPDIGGRQLSFWVQNTEQLDRPAAKYIINGDSWINVTDGGLDMAVTPDYNSVLVHPVVGYNTLQVTKMYVNSRRSFASLIRSRDGQMLKEITIKHIARQPNLLVIDELIFLTTENEGRGMVTVLDNDLEV